MWKKYRIGIFKLAKRFQEGICQICGRELECYVSAYQDHPFIDGRTYKEICFVCASIPKMSNRVINSDGTEEFILYDTFDRNRLNTVDDLLPDGFAKDEILKSLKAVRAAIKKPKGETNHAVCRHEMLLNVKYVPAPPQPIPVVEEDMSKHRRRRHRHKNRQQKKNNDNKEFNNSHIHSNKLGPKREIVTIREISESALDDL